MPLDWPIFVYWLQFGGLLNTVWMTDYKLSSSSLIKKKNFLLVLDCISSVRHTFNQELSVRVMWIFHDCYGNIIPGQT